MRELAQPAGRVVVIEAGPTDCALSQGGPSVLADRAGWRRAVTSPRSPHRAKESLRTAYVPVLLVKVALANVLLGLATGGPPSVGSLL